MFLSIIVPVYNVETYLRKCVGSLLDQDLPKADYEIILIDDGSTDNSGRLCDLFASSYSNINVIHQPNKGLSAARNAGISSAKGRYIQFVDSDDYLNPNVLGGIVRQLEALNLDVLRINYQNVNEAGDVFEPNNYSKPFDDYTTEVCDGLTFLNERMGYACYAVQLVIKRSILQQNGSGFKEGVYYEDTEWAPRILVKTERVASCQTMAYNYLYRQGSISRSTDLKRKHKAVEDKLGLIESLREQAKNLNDRSWFDGMTAQTVLSVLAEVSRFFYPRREQYLRRLKDLNVFPLSTYHATSSALKKIRIANLSPELLCIMLHLKNS